MPKYDDEFKRQTVKKVFDGQSVSSVSPELGVNESLIHKRKRDALDHGTNGLTSAESKENIALKKRIKELETDNEIIKKAALVFGRGS